MQQEIWINLPVKDVAAATAFFTKIGFSVNERNSGSEFACILAGEKNLVFMLFPHETFNGFTNNGSVDTQSGTETLFSIGLESRAAVDAMAAKVTEAGGILSGEPRESGGWMYGCGFADLDGHRWNLLYMDMSKQPTVSKAEDAV